MAKTTPSINLTILDRDEIKQSLINFLKQNPTFSGFNFDGSNLNQILDIMAYAKSQDAYMAHVGINEGTLMTCNDERMAISHANALGYVPQSTTSARATLSVLSTSPSTTSIPAGSNFSMTIDGETTINFTNQEEISIPAGSQTLTIPVIEGSWKQVSYVANRIQHGMFTEPLKLVIPDNTVDITTIEVVVTDETNTSSFPYTRQEHVPTPFSADNVFWVQKNTQGFYEVLLSSNAPHGEKEETQVRPITARVSYIVSSGSQANSAFQGTDPINISVSFPSVSPATLEFDSFVEYPYGAAEKEEIQSIKFFAPRMYATQNRAVTASDYESIIGAKIPGIETIRVLGGDELTPPQYGKVFISLKYTNRTTIPDSVKSNITKILRDNGMINTQIVFYEPDYIFVLPIVRVKYQPLNLNTTGSQVTQNTAAAVIDFSTNTLNEFGADLWSSELDDHIRKFDTSIVSVGLVFSLQKKLVSVNNMLVTPSFNFENPLIPGTLSSSEFTYYDYVAKKPRTSKLIDDGLGNVNIVWYDSSTVRVIQTVGTINYSSGKVNLAQFAPISIPNDLLSIHTTVNGEDVAADSTSILTISPSGISVTAIKV